MTQDNTLGVDFAIRKLEADELVPCFNCVDDDLNDFIINEAQDYRRALIAVTYVLTLKNSPELVIAFWSLANDKVSITDFGNTTEYNKFRKKQGFPQPKRLKSYPAVKLYRLGVDVNFHGHSAGTKLLNFIKTYFTIDNKTGCRFITVDAYIDAIPFYEKNGFRPLSSSDKNAAHTRTLFFDLQELM